MNCMALTRLVETITTAAPVAALLQTCRLVGADTALTATPVKSAREMNNGYRIDADEPELRCSTIRE